MFRFLFRKPTRAQGRPLNETQGALVAKKFEILRQASFGFTQDRLLHIQEEDLKGWTDACSDELRRQVVSAAPSHMKIVLIEFRKLRCVSLQCFPLWAPAGGARLAYGVGPAQIPSVSKERTSEARSSSLLGRAPQPLFRCATERRTAGSPTRRTLTWTL
jgi:hypothetical protein